MGVWGRICVCIVLVVSCLNTLLSLSSTWVALYLYLIWNTAGWPDVVGGWQRRLQWGMTWALEKLTAHATAIDLALYCAPLYLYLLWKYSILFYINSICFWTNKILNSVAYSIMNLKSLSIMKSRQILVCFLLLPCRYSSLSNCGIKSCTTSERSSHNCWSPKASCDVDLSENQNYTWTAVMFRIVSSLLMSSEALCCVG